MQLKSTLSKDDIIPIMYISNHTLPIGWENVSLGDISPVSAGASILLGPLGDMYRVSSQRSSNLGITSIQAISRTYGNVNILTNLTSQTMMAILFQQEGFQKRGAA